MESRKLTATLLAAYFTFGCLALVQGQGECVCTTELDPVCSTEGEQFSNACAALCTGAVVGCNGTCPCAALSPAGTRPSPAVPVAAASPAQPTIPTAVPSPIAVLSPVALPSPSSTNPGIPASGNPSPGNPSPRPTAPGNPIPTPGSPIIPNPIPASSPGAVPSPKSAPGGFPASPMPKAEPPMSPAVVPSPAPTPLPETFAPWLTPYFGRPATSFAWTVSNFDCKNNNLTLKLAKVSPATILGADATLDPEDNDEVDILSITTTVPRNSQYHYIISTGRLLNCKTSDDGTRPDMCASMSLNTVLQGVYIAELLEMKTIAHAVATQGWRCAQVTGIYPTAEVVAIYLDHIVTQVIKRRIVGFPVV